MNLPNTAVGKTAKTLIWVAVSGAIAYLISFFGKNPDFFNPAVVAIINIVLVALKNVLDPNVQNV